jgi:DNA-binding response OmpR family regulator
MAGNDRKQRQIRKVMILEDEQNILNLYNDFEYERSFFIVTSTSAKAAVNDHEKYSPDFVIIDYKLPGKNGLQAAKEILMRCLTVRILMLTAFDGVKDDLEKDLFFDD